MGMLDRVSTILRANINDLLDRAEDPEKMIRQLLQDMENQLIQVKTQVAAAIADEQRLKERWHQNQQLADEWQRKAELALSKNREDLARAALTEKAKLAQDLKDMDEELVLLDEGLVKYEEDIAKLEAKLREAKAKQKVILARQATAVSRLKVRRQVHDQRIDDAFVRFEQMERRLDTAESEVEAFDLGRSRTLADEIEELAADSVVEEELRALKSKLGRGQASSGGA